MLRLDASLAPRSPRLPLRALSLVLPAAALTAALVACGSDDESVGRRTSGGDGPSDGSVPTTTSDAGRTCAGLSLQTHPKPACDQCAKSTCCDKVLACADSDDCTALMQCLEPCASDDEVCILTCQVVHEKGSELLLDLGSCVQARCKSECPTESVDAGPDPFDDDGGF